MAVHVVSTPKKWMRCVMQPENSTSQLPVYWRFVNLLSPETRYSTATILQRLSTRLLEWAVIFDANIIQKIKHDAMRRF